MMGRAGAGKPRCHVSPARGSRPSRRTGRVSSGRVSSAPLRSAPSRPVSSPRCALPAVCLSVLPGSRCAQAGMDLARGGWARDAAVPPARPVASAAPGAVDPLLSLVHSVCSGVSGSELSAVKFLCRDKVPKGKLEAAQSALELCVVLMERQVITREDLGFLKKLLQHIGRDDLVARVTQFEEEGPHAPDDQPDAHEKRLLEAACDVICHNVGREWKKLMRELRMPEVKLDRIETAHRYDLYEQLVQGLREWQKGKGKDAKVADLIKALRGCNLNLVADMVEDRISQLNTGTR